MARDLLIALVITVIAVALGLTVHPVLFFLVVLALAWLFVGPRYGRRHHVI